jgi:hypothetical protein
MPQWLSGDCLLPQFGNNLREAKRNYKAFVEGVDPRSLENPGKSPMGGFILGGLDFINWVKAEFLSKDKKLNRRIKRLEKRILNN